MSLVRIAGKEIPTGGSSVAFVTLLSVRETRCPLSLGKPTAHQKINPGLSDNTIAKPVALLWLPSR